MLLIVREIDSRQTLQEYIDILVKYNGIGDSAYYSHKIKLFCAIGRNFRYVHMHVMYKDSIERNCS